MNRNYLTMASLMAALTLTSCQRQDVLPYQNPELSPEERAQDLLSRLTLEQKAQLMQDISEAIPELGIQKYNWWNEALHGAARSGLATVFPQAIGMAASWDPDLLHDVMTVASNEQRIKYIQARRVGNVKRYDGLTVWTPNINIFRDPRWGRGQETYGEDPYLTRVMGYAVVNGLQGTDEGFKGGDRISIQLPKIQRQTLERLHRTGKPVVFVNLSGSAMSLTPELKTCDAILQGWYGGQQGGQAVAEVLLGKYNPAGRLPITFYDSERDLPDFHDYNVKGHTYRYFNGRPVFSFGYGLGYSTFVYGQAQLAQQGNEVSINVPVTNTSNIDGEEVVQVYLKRDNDVDGPIKALRGFKRVKIAAGQTINVTVSVGDLSTFDVNTQRMAIVPGQHTLYVGSSSRDEDLQQLSLTL